VKAGGLASEDPRDEIEIRSIGRENHGDGNDDVQTISRRGVSQESDEHEARKAVKNR
jgi:hypothetical protein